MGMLMHSTMGVALLIVVTALALAELVHADAFLGGPSPAFLTETSSWLQPTIHMRSLENKIVDVIRGGATVEEEEEIEFESSDEEADDEEDEEEEELDPKLAKSAQAATLKVKAKATEAAKATVSATLAAKALKATTKSKKNKSGMLKLFKIPYIIRATLNPFTLFRMTKGYFASLFNLNYLNDKMDTSQDLRNALEQKAKKGGGTGGTRGKRKMKPGQAKTLSDLPQLNT